MRDFLMLLLFPVMMYTMAKRPFIAVGMWVWTALFFPNGWLYGVASVIRFNLAFAAIAILSYLVSKDKPKVTLGSVGGLVLLFFIWTTLSSIMTMATPDATWEVWNRFSKVVMLFFMVLLVVENKLHVDFLLWCVVLSVGFYADLEGLKFVASGGGHNIVGMPTHVLGDRNELAVAFVMTLPICFYLLTEYGSRSKILQLGLLATIALLVISVIGTMSRGGFIALTVLGGYLYVKSDRKILLTILIVALVIGASYIVSADWSARVASIKTADHDDSFMGRVVAWKLSFIMAVHHPFFGGGFKALEYFPVWKDLSKEFFSYSWFYTGDALPNTSVARAAHSVYFQVLGDHGFVGLGIYLSTMAAVFFKARRVAKIAKREGAPPWIANAATTVQLSLFAFAVGAAALSFAYFDLIFTVFALAQVLEARILPAALAAKAAQLPRAQDVQGVQGVQAGQAPSLALAKEAL
jgi:probable O-glycosylation ligase (exosortase A-associated)